MADYEIEFSTRAAQQMRRLPGEMQKRVKSVIDGLTLDPRPPGVLRMAGRQDLWRIRVGVYRVVYTIEDDRLVVLVVRIGPRRDVYPRL
jgi:mRNA interferase RelE/StbE